MASTTTEVLVVGAGPTGLSLAVALRARGRNVTVVDRLPQGDNTSRAGVVHARTMEVLEPYGIATRLACQGIRARRFTVRDRDQVLTPIDFDKLPTAYQYTLLISQAHTEATLVQRLHELGGDVLRPYTLTRLEQDSAGVTASFDAGQRMRATYLVGADGMHSTVRQQVQLELRAGTGESFALADVHLSGGVPRDEVVLYFSSEGHVVVVPFPDESFRIVANVAHAPENPDVAFVQNILDTRGPAAERAVVHDVLWGSRFLVHHGVCDTFRVGRIVLAGDAAHVNSPVGGQGMNDGILDAVALAAALDAALERGTSEPLQSYNTRQRRIARQVIAVTNALTRVATIGPRLRPIRNAMLSAVSPFVRRRIAWQLSLLAYR